jgi:hypothetical protein
MKYWTLKETIAFIAEAIVLLFVCAAILILSAGVVSGDMSSADVSLVLATLALSIATFLLARHSIDLSEMEAKRVRRISIENSERIAAKILDDTFLDSISETLSNRILPAKHQYTRELLKNLPPEEKDLKRLTIDIMKTMEAAVYGTQADCIVNAGKAQDLYKELRDKMRDAASRWRQEL